MWELMFRALALRESRNCRYCVNVVISGATLLMRACNVKNKNMSVQLKAFIDSVGIESATLDLIFFLSVLPQTAICL